MSQLRQILHGTASACDFSSLPQEDVVVHRDDTREMSAETADISTAYAQTERLCQDFGLHIMVAHQDPNECGGVTDCVDDGSAGSFVQPSPVDTCPRRFALAADDQSATTRLTPYFSTLSHLEHYVAGNLVDILHLYFFGEGKLDEQGVESPPLASIAR